MVKLAAYVLPEFGHLISDAPGKGFEDQFKALRKHFPTAGAKTKAILMTGFTKLCKSDPSLTERVAPILNNFSTYWDEDIQ